eukprot:TRINITY_DN49366_c0_g1_i1.p1 TRINITY_DN49366_c0_g1~~TRINITY_DN49366_c0_g1_i1.p1  ORF type:complete len:258 (+),score=58.84 TRINITY_DN49366_c0_g1_i1:68-841(+)
MDATAALLQNGEHRELLPLSPEVLSQRRTEQWRARMDSAWERAAQRSEAAQRQEAHLADLERRRKEAAERRAIEEQRRHEAAARALQRQKEAAEYSSWRDSVVLARKAEERDRTREFCQWRSRVGKLSQGLPVPAPGLGDPLRSQEVAVARVAPPPLAARSLPSSEHGSWKEVSPSERLSTPRTAGSRSYASRAAWEVQEFPDYVTGFGLEGASKLEEEQAWKEAVARNRATIAEHRKAAAVALAKQSPPRGAGSPT